MRVIKTAAIVALMSGCAIATMDARPASAFSLGDFIRAGRKKSDSAEQTQPAQPLPGLGGMIDPQQNMVAKPLPKVTGPKYYTYKAEALRRIATDKLLDPVVTGSVRNDALPPMLRTPLADARQFLPGINVRASGDVAKAVEAHYGARMDYIWIGAEGVNAKAKAAIAVLADAAKVGLDPQDYAVNVPSDTFDRGDMIAREKELLQFEISLSAATLTYAQDTVRGRIDRTRSPATTTSSARRSNSRRFSTSCRRAKMSPRSSTTRTRRARSLPHSPSSWRSCGRKRVPNSASRSRRIRC